MPQRPKEYVTSQGEQFQALQADYNSATRMHVIYNWVASTDYQPYTRNKPSRGYRFANDGGVIICNDGVERHLEHDDYIIRIWDMFYTVQPELFELFEVVLVSGTERSMGDPEPIEDVTLVSESLIFNGLRANRTMTGLWKIEHESIEGYLEWDELVQRFEPLIVMEE